MPNIAQQHLMHKIEQQHLQNNIEQQQFLLQHKAKEHTVL